jgi:large subunit ribosomal protein L22
MENTLQATASLRNFRGSARKARLILDMIRGKKVAEAKNILQFSTKKMSKDIHKLLNSAVSNATQVGGKLDETTLHIEKCWADDGMIMKRTMPRAQGTANMIRKRTCHITVCISGSKKVKQTAGEPAATE